MSSTIRKVEKVEFAENQVLTLSLNSPGDTFSEAVLYVHGFGSVRQGQKSRAFERTCESRGWTFAAADFRGHGESSGTMLDLCGTNLQTDLDLVVEHLKIYGLKRLFLVGSSMGGWASAWFTLRHPELVKACVFLAPSFDFPQQRWDTLTEEERQEWQRKGKRRFRNEFLDVELSYRLVEERDQFPLEKLYQEWQKPLWIAHGLQDEIIPYTKSIAFLEQVKCKDVELHLLKDGNHRLEKHRKQIAEDACNFFTRQQ